jgi:hypothetical protein
MNKLRPWISWALLVLVFFALARRQDRFIRRYSVNLMWYDQFAIYGPDLIDMSWWHTFDLQWGPHRQGLGGVVARALGEIGHYDSTWDAYEIAYALILAAAAAVAVAYCCGARQPWALLAIPILYFNRRQLVQMLGAPNISHGAMPVLLFTLFCLSWFVKNRNLRLLLVTMLTFFMIFTGFSIFVGLIAPPLLLIELIQNLRAKRPFIGIIVALVGLGLSWWLFSYNYIWFPAVPDFKFPYDRPIEYFYFVGVMLSNFYGYTGHTMSVVAFGLFIASILVILCAIHGWRLTFGGVEQKPVSVVIFSLAAYTLLFCANTAIGRVSLDWKSAAGENGSRYVTLMIPGGLAILLQLLTLRIRLLANVLALLFAVAIYHGTTHLNQLDWDQIHWLSGGKTRWKHYYLLTHDWAKTNQLSGFHISDDTSIMGEMNSMEAHHQNLFKGR